MKNIETNGTIDCFLKSRDVCEILKMSRTGLHKWVKEGNFPAPVQLSKRSVAWRQSEVEEWMASRERAAWASEHNDSDAA